MNEPKRLVYHYDRNRQPANREDTDGTFPVPDEGALIINSGRRWEVLRVSREDGGNEIPVYRIFLSSSLG
jgi:hypothetical protein